VPKNQISVVELLALKDSGAEYTLVDVRDPWEFEEANLNGKLIPLVELPQRLSELKKEQHIIVHCQMGGRSARACEYLRAEGFTHVQNLTGGMQAWLREIGH